MMWVLVCYGSDDDGSSKAQAFGGYDSKSEAEEAEAEVRELCPFEVKDVACVDMSITFNSKRIGRR